MSIQELIDAAKQRVISEQEIADLQKRLQVADEEFKKQAQAKSVNHQFLSRAYSL